MEPDPGQVIRQQAKTIRQQAQTIRRRAIGQPSYCPPAACAYPDSQRLSRRSLAHPLPTARPQAMLSGAQRLRAL